MPARTPRAVTPSSASNATPSVSQRSVREPAFPFEMEIMQQIKAAQAANDASEVVYWKDQLVEHNKRRCAPAVEHEHAHMRRIACDVTDIWK